MKNLKKTITLLVLLITVLSACNKDNNKPANQAPEAFSLVGVSDGESNVDVMPNFSWTAATDPEGDTVSYDLYIDGNENPTTLFAEDIMATSYQPQERLSLTNQYYWKVVAKDNKGNSTESDTTFSFTTRNLNLPNTAVTTNAAFSARSSHTTVVFDNKLWVIGGYDGDGKRDRWHSKDGSNWTDATIYPTFSARSSHTATLFDNKVWVIGGRDDEGRKNDVWHVWNSTDGSIWTQLMANAAFSARDNHTTVVFKERLWVIGGRDDEGRKNDVWQSTDGSIWTQAAANAAFSARDNHTAVVFKEQLWVIGGRDDKGRKNDVWHSKDGSNWKQATANAAFSVRSSHTTAVFDNKLWVIGGYDGSNRKNDIWHSADGINWIEATDNANFSARSSHTTVVFDNKLWIIGGNDDEGRKNDVWYMD